MGEKIHPECLSVDEDSVFVNFTDGAIGTASKEYYRRWKDSSVVARLLKPLSFIPAPGQRLRKTNFHFGLPVKIEARVEKHWQTIYEIDELPEGFTCLAGCYIK